MFLGLFEKWSTFNDKNFALSFFENWCLWFPYILKKSKEIKNVNFWSILAVFVLSSILIYCRTEKKKDLNFCFITPSILLIEFQLVCYGKHIADKDSEIFFTRRTKLCSLILVSKIINFYRYIENEKSNTSVFFCACQ